MSKSMWTCMAALVAMSGCCAAADQAYKECTDDYRLLARECKSGGQVTSDAGRCPPCAKSGGGAAAITELDDNDMIAVLKEEGYDPVLHSEGAVKFAINGITTVLFRKDQTLQCYAGFRSSKPLEAVNEWNKGYRFTRAYIDNDGDVAIESDLNLGGGVSSANISTFIRIFAISLKTFVDEMGKH